jgi:ADP-dependent phosphofructokinase/glucokinase
MAIEQTAKTLAGREVADAALKELNDLSQYLEKEEGIQGFSQSGLGRAGDFWVAALPTILIEKPVTLVGMGDTISSLSLAGSLVQA